MLYVRKNGEKKCRSPLTAINDGGYINFHTWCWKAQEAKFNKWITCVSRRHETPFDEENLKNTLVVSPLEQKIDDEKNKTCSPAQKIPFNSQNAASNLKQNSHMPNMRTKTQWKIPQCNEIFHEHSEEDAFAGLVD